MREGEHSTPGADAVWSRLPHLAVLVPAILWCGSAYAEVGQIANGSFEPDGRIADVTKRAPSGWTVDLAGARFGGTVDSAWATDGQFNLTLFTQWYAPLQAGDMAVVSQQADLTDVNEITFDVKLDTYYGSRWDPNACSAALVIDDEVVWEVNLPGTFLRRAYRVENEYRDHQLHSLALALRVNIDLPKGLSDFYRVSWDAVRCTAFAAADGLLPGDVDGDGFVDARDLMMVAGMWAAEVPADSVLNLRAGAAEDPNAVVGRVNFYDLAVLGENWLANSPVQEE
jgi:hypothetical protein